MPDFNRRSTLPEKMDQPGVPSHEIQQALRELEIVNTQLGGYSLLIHALSDLQLPEKFSLMDFGCGGGDMLRVISKWANKHHKHATLTGIDWNAVMTGYAAEKSKQYPDINYRTLSVFDDALLQHRADITTCSLFCHHFEDEALIDLLQRMYHIADKAVVINDLHRNWFAYYSIKYITSIFSKTYLVKYDAPLSVARAFTRSEWQEILYKANISNYTLKWRWAWRWELILYK